MSTSGKQNVYITPENHPAGVLFPSWVNYNYKKYKLDKPVLTKGVDPCLPTKEEKKTKLPLRKYQQFLQQYMTYDSPFHNILLYWGLGVGKTRASISIYNILYSHDARWNVFILLKKSLIKTWEIELKKWLEYDRTRPEQAFKESTKNISFINYDAPNANDTFVKITKEKFQNGNKNVFIIDEVHNFINNVYNNIKTQTGRRAREIYDKLLKYKKHQKYTRFIFISATPAINQPFELALLFNLLRPLAFPIKESEFTKIFIASAGTNPVLKPESKNLFKRRVLGLVSYYGGATRDRYASKKIHSADLEMTDYQNEIYTFFEKKEDEIERRSKQFGTGTNVSTYKNLTRQLCNFVYPNIDSKYNGLLRPKPAMYRIHLRDLEKIEKGTMQDKLRLKSAEAAKYKEALADFLKKLVAYWNTLMKDDIKEKHTMQDDITFMQKNDITPQSYFFDSKRYHKYMTDKKREGEEYYKGDNKYKVSSLYFSMYNSSPKMTNISTKVLNHKGNSLIYSNYVGFEGLDILKIYLGFFGFKSYFSDNREDYLSYTEYHGGVPDLDKRELGRTTFNLPENNYGKIIKVIMISPTGTEGISLSNTTMVQIIEPHWNEVRIEQIIGRAIRQCSHKDLPLDERHVNVYRYKMRRTRQLKETTDEFIENLAKKKYQLIKTFLNAMKEAAIDCTLFKEHNKLIEGDYNCFKFDAESQLSKDLGYIYKKRIENELGKPGKGSDSEFAQTIMIGTELIDAVQKKSDNKYGKKKKYWYYPEKGYVYDHDLDYLVGKVRVDDDGIPEMFDKDTYIIGNLVKLANYKIYEDTTSISNE